MGTYRLRMAYDGTNFRGYAVQPGVRTVQGELEAALERRLGPVTTVVAGRTDAGVHARGQVVSFGHAGPVETDRLLRSLNAMLGPEIAVQACDRVGDGFSARFSATSRTYHYCILNTPVQDPLRRFTAWHVPEPLDIDAMNIAISSLVGEHDFASFCRKAPGRSTERTVLDAVWSRAGELVELRVTATAFCHQMVRSIVALCVDVGRGRVAVETVPSILAARDRNAARGAAPPLGLVLWSVDYPT